VAQPMIRCPATQPRPSTGVTLDESRINSPMTLLGRDITNGSACWTGRRFRTDVPANTAARSRVPPPAARPSDEGPRCHCHASGSPVPRPNTPWSPASGRRKPPPGIGRNGWAMTPPHARTATTCVVGMKITRCWSRRRPLPRRGDVRQDERPPDPTAGDRTTTSRSQGASTRDDSLPRGPAVDPDRH
jgi:hypothetical protein